MDTYGLYALVAVLAVVAVYAIRQVATGRGRWSGGKRQSPAEKRRAQVKSEVDELLKGRPIGSEAPRRNNQVDTSEDAIRESAEAVLRRMRKPRE
ncbi:MAG: hypothetical protein NUV85_02215 [Candidatus Berkelbacteria bacterium]|nr:hypothetical protein [Candidatus Berkelbacteria bacterium]